MVSQQQAQNQIESPANILQQPHNFDVQVSLITKIIFDIFIHFLCTHKLILFIYISCVSHDYEENQLFYLLNHLRKFIFKLSCKISYNHIEHGV